MATRYLIWDFDGTLASRDGLWSQTLAEVANREFAHARFSREDFVPHLRTGFFWQDFSTPHTHIRTSAAWWESMAPVLCAAMQNVTATSHQNALRMLPKIRAAYIDPRCWRVFPDVDPCLRALGNQGWRNILCSNHVPELPQILAALGLSANFVGLCNSAETGYEKPHPAAFAHVRSMLPDPGTTWMIGDNYHADIAGARAAGIPGILVRKHHPEAEHFHATLESLPGFLAQA
jgi:putative hydrolase of the HAD superfamily